MGYLVPDSVNEDGSDVAWANLSNAIDGDWDTYASCVVPQFYTPPDWAVIGFVYDVGHDPDVVKIKTTYAGGNCIWLLYGYWSAAWRLIANEGGGGAPPRGEYAVANSGNPVTKYRLELIDAMGGQLGGNLYCYELAGHVADPPAGNPAYYYRRNAKRRSN